MRKPIVAILGRPNVGKSTLFNRIIKRREAIVDDQPGVTRDRKYALAEWAGCIFDLLDTGGYVPSSEDVFEQAIRDQVNFAIDEADVICFVTDATVGITPIDLEISRILLRSKVPLVLAVNKADNESREQEIYDFYKLGMGDPMPISAIGGRGIGDLLDELVGNIPEELLHHQPEDKENMPIQLAVIGRPNVGKSSYVNAILGKEKMIVTNIAGTTRDAIDTPYVYNDTEFTLIDTAGLRRRSRVKESVEFFSSVRSSNAIRRCDVAVLLIDASEGLTDQDKKVMLHAVEAGKGLILCVNKWDLVEKETNTAKMWEDKMREYVRELGFVPIVFISAVTRQRVYKVLDLVIDIYHERRKRIQTADLNKFLEDVVEEHHPPAFGTKWVKLNYIAQVAIEPPLFAVYTNEPKGIKDNYRNYMENKLRQTFGFVGVPIRLSFRKKN